VVVLLVAASATARADVVTYYSGDLRTNGNVLDCGAGCTLGASNTDGDYAQWAAVTYNFTVTTATTIQAITYSYGGGTSLTGALVAPGGLEPYLSLFDGSGNFLTSSYGSSAPREPEQLAAIASMLGGHWVHGGSGTYTIALSAFENMSYAETLALPICWRMDLPGWGTWRWREPGYGFRCDPGQRGTTGHYAGAASGVLLVTGLLSRRFDSKTETITSKETSL